MLPAHSTTVLQPRWLIHDVFCFTLVTTCSFLALMTSQCLAWQAGAEATADPMLAAGLTNGRVLLTSFPGKGVPVIHKEFVPNVCVLLILLLHGE